MGRIFCRIIACTFLVVAAASYASPAMAKSTIPADPSCPAATDVQLTAQWTPSDDIVDGIRSPVELRTDGLLCVNPPSYAPDISEWIAINNTAGTKIAQIGFIHTFNDQDVSEYCRFWGTGSGSNVTLYDCTGQADHEYVYFLIQVDVDQNYAIEDCGAAGDFDNCVTEDDSEAVFSSAFAESASEADYACTEEMLGSNPDPVNFGNDSWGQVGENGEGWVVKNWSANGPYNDSNGNSDCTSDYEIGISGDIVTMWDSRETG
jgi:hypothetical protein